jgi:hypothetical protein
VIRRRATTTEPSAALRALRAFGSTGKPANRQPGARVIEAMGELRPAERQAPRHLRAA